MFPLGAFFLTRARSYGQKNAVLSLTLAPSGGGELYCGLWSVLKWASGARKGGESILTGFHYLVVFGTGRTGGVNVRRLTSPGVWMEVWGCDNIGKKKLFRTSKLKNRSRQDGKSLIYFRQGSIRTKGGT